MPAAPPIIAHMARLHQQKMWQASAKPHGNYDHATFQFGVIDTIHAGPPLSVDLYLDGSQNTANTDYLTTGVPVLAGYVPTVGDTVIVYRGVAQQRSDRFVLGKLASAPSPSATPLGGYDSAGRYTQEVLNAWGSASTPPASLGAAGDWCFSADGHIWWNNAGTWQQKV